MTSRLIASETDSPPPQVFQRVDRRLKEVGIRVPNLAGIAEVVKELQPFTHPDPAPNLGHRLRDDEIRNDEATSQRTGESTGVCVPSVPPVGGWDEEAGVGENHRPPL